MSEEVKKYCDEIVLGLREEDYYVAREWVEQEAEMFHMRLEEGDDENVLLAMEERYGYGMIFTSYLTCKEAEYMYQERDDIEEADGFVDINLLEQYFQGKK